jgi:hypothetical protein
MKIIDLQNKGQRKEAIHLFDEMLLAAPNFEWTPHTNGGIKVATALAGVRLKDQAIQILKLTVQQTPTRTLNQIFEPEHSTLVGDLYSADDDLYYKFRKFYEDKKNGIRHLT